MGYMGMDLITKADYEELDYLIEKLIPSRDEIYIFGRGVYGKSFAKYLTTLGIKIDGFIVSGNCTNDDVNNKDTMVLSDFINYYETSGKSILVLMALSSKFYGEVYPDLMFLQDDLYMVSEKYLLLSQYRCGCSENITLTIPVVDYCTAIACFGCTAAVPVATCKSKYTLEEYMGDMDKIKELIGENVCHVNFTGGDVFLHSELIEMIEYARKLYPQVLIDLSSNGVSFDVPDDNFWVRAGNVGIEINWTLYPIKYKNWGGTVSKIKKLSNGNVKINIVGDSSGESKSSWCLPYTESVEKKQDWLFCGIHKCNTNTLMIYHNSISVCPAPRALNYLTKKFCGELSDSFVENVDYKKHVLTIDQIKNCEEIYDFMTKRPILCDYCAIRERHSMGKWLSSHGKFEEWFIKKE